MTDSATEHSLTGITTVSSVEGWQALLEKSNVSKEAVVLQIGSEWCKNCPPALQRIRSLNSKYKFEFVYADSNESDLAEHFQISRLPTVVVYNPNSTSPPTIVQAVTPAQLDSLIHSHASPVLQLEEDF